MVGSGGGAGGAAAPGTAGCSGGGGGGAASSSVKPRPAATRTPISGSRFGVTPSPFTCSGGSPGAVSGALNGVMAAMSSNAVLLVRRSR
jgi:hypothetical protein